MSGRKIKGFFVAEQTLLSSHLDKLSENKIIILLCSLFYPTEGCEAAQSGHFYQLHTHDEYIGCLSNNTIT